MTESLESPLVPPSEPQPSADYVNHPPHYKGHPAGIETIEVTRHANFNIGNAIKYLWRVMWGSKGNDIEDLKKARWYVDDEIKRRGGET